MHLLIFYIFFPPSNPHQRCSIKTFSSCWVIFQYFEAKVSVVEIEIYTRASRDCKQLLLMEHNFVCLDRFPISLRKWGSLAVSKHYIFCQLGAHSHYSNWNSHPQRAADEAQWPGNTEEIQAQRHSLAIFNVLKIFLFFPALAHTLALCQHIFCALLTVRYQGNKIIIFNECSPLILITKKCALCEGNDLKATFFLYNFSSKTDIRWGGGI